MDPDYSVAFVLGTRPEVIKLAPVIRECRTRGVAPVLIHTGQHYSDSLNDVFFEQLGLPTPSYDLGVGSASHGTQTGEMIAEVESTLLDIDADVLLVQGDTNSVLAGAVAGSKLEDVTVAHVEAGLRSYETTMPEEVNRRLTDHAANILFPPTETARENLFEESVPADHVRVTGNTVVDAVFDHVERAREQSDVHERYEAGDDYALLTAHRAENVDDADRFASLLASVGHTAERRDLDVFYPVHPRAEAQIQSAGIDVPNQITLLDPLDFLDFLVFEDGAEIVFTDSGGIQEETCILGTPCVTLRDNTERPETVDVGANVVAGVEHDDVERATETMLSRSTDWENPFGDGTAAEQILDTLEETDV
jgi:UDP-N-acetylglucosamine 2-epimerase (non-hydrolysing)